MADITELRRRMDGALNTLKHEFAGLRTGRASPNLLDTVMVEAYGAMTPLLQVANINVPEPRLITVSVWDKSMVKAVEKGILNANLGLNPQSDGQVVRVPLPELSQERRQELVKIASKQTEATRIAIRNVRRDGMDFAKKQEKDGKISKDGLEKEEAAIQKLTDEHIKKADDMFAAKEKDIMQV